MRKSEIITKLLFQHGDTYMECSGCEICNQIRSISNRQENRYAKHSKVFNKGADMTLTEVKFLLERSVPREVLRHQLKQSTEEFRTTLLAIGMYKPNKRLDINWDEITKEREAGALWKDIAKKFDISEEYLLQLRRMKGIEDKKPKKDINVEEVVRLKKEGYKWKEIAKHLGISGEYLSQIRKKKGIDEMLYPKSEQLKENKLPSARKRNEFSKETREKILELQGPCCYVCESPSIQLHHVKFRKQSGRGVKRNGLPLCHFHHNDHTYGIHHNSKFRKEVEALFIERFGPDYYKDKYDLYLERKISEPSDELVEEYFKKEGFE